MKMPALTPAFKQQVHAHCLALVGAKVQSLRRQLDDLKTTIAAETKSTAGDKYETARAMIHIEQERINRQLAEAQAQASALAQIAPDIHPVIVTKGSLVATAQGCFFVSTGIGKIVVDDIPVFAVSPQSPVGLALSGLSVGDTAVVNGQRYTIAALS